MNGYGVVEHIGAAGDRLLAGLSYLVNGLLVVLGLSAQEWYWMVGAGCAVVTTYVLAKYKRLHYDLRRREVELAERLAIHDLEGKDAGESANPL